VVLSALWPANICTSRNDPPTVEIVRAALVMNVRLPEWLEQPCNPAALYQLANRFTIALADVRSDRSVVMT
jgi:hypothetical protein